MIKRILEGRLRALALKFPIVTVTGPRQSGKTTLCRAVFPDKPYVSLEAPDIQAYARRDPRGFLAEHQSGAILDEVHRGVGSGLSFYRDRKGVEVDLVIENGNSLRAVEIKSGKTVGDDFFDGPDGFEAVMDSASPKRNVNKYVIYGGDMSQKRSSGTVVSWSEVNGHEWW